MNMSKEQVLKRMINKELKEKIGLKGNDGDCSNLLREKN